ncbi:MAG: flagellar basal body P-ring protein FlgI [Candidatus Pacebacteria bacterium]|nr:flagellar basal body P-ring protein FlgI [Candidatus Paceibacterota bacterium]
MTILLRKTSTILLRLVVGLALVLAPLPIDSARAAETARIKDLVAVEGVRDNQLVGYGLVVGLANTGDTLNRSIFTRESLIGMLERLGVNARTANDEMRTRNLAAVMVTATLPPFTRQGGRIDVSVSMMGDASSMQGGTLIATPLMAADGEVYAVAQGPVEVSGFAARGQAQSVVRGVPTSGRIVSGAIVEKEVGFEMKQLTNLRLNLRNPDFTTARRISQAINSMTGETGAKTLDHATIQVEIPKKYQGDIVQLIADVETLTVEPDYVAKIVIDEKSGIIVMGANVRVSTVAIAQGNLTIRITEQPEVSQPLPFAPGPGSGTQTLNDSNQIQTVPQPRLDSSGQPVLDASGNPVFDYVPQIVPGRRAGVGANNGGAQTVVVPRTQIDVNDSAGNRLAIVPSGVTLGELVNGLNALGVGPRDLIPIIQAIKAAGALQASIEII